MDINKLYDELTKGFKSGESAADYCRACKGLLKIEEGDATICQDCVMNMMRKGR